MYVRTHIRKDVRTYTHTSPLHAKLAHCQVMPRCGSCGSIQCAFGAYVRTYLFLNCCSHLALLEQWALRIFSRLQETLDDVPYGIRWLCKAIRVLVKVRRAFCSVGEWGVLLCGGWGVLLCGGVGGAGCVGGWGVLLCGGWGVLLCGGVGCAGCVGKWGVLLCGGVECAGCVGEWGVLLCGEWGVLVGSGVRTYVCVCCVCSYVHE